MKLGLRGGVYLFPRPPSSSLHCYFQAPATQASSGRVETRGIFCTSAVRSRLACHSEGHELGNTFSLVGCKSCLKIILRVFLRSTAHSTLILPTHCFHFSFYNISNCGKTYKSKLSMNILASQRTWHGLALAVRDSSGMNGLKWRHEWCMLSRRVCEVWGHPSIKVNTAYRRMVHPFQEGVWGTGALRSLRGDSIH